MGVRGLWKFVRRYGQPAEITGNLASELAGFKCTMIVDTANLCFHLLKSITTPHELNFAPPLWKLPGLFEEWYSVLRHEIPKSSSVVFVLEGLEVGTVSPPTNEATVKVLETGQLLGDDFELEDNSVSPDELRPAIFMMMLPIIRSLKAHFLVSRFEADEDIVNLARKEVACGQRVLVFSDDSDFLLVRNLEWNIVRCSSMELASLSSDRKTRFVLSKGFSNVREAFLKAFRESNLASVSANDFPDELLLLLPELVDEGHPIFENPWLLLDFRERARTRNRFDPETVNSKELAIRMAIDECQQVNDSEFLREVKSRVYRALQVYGGKPTQLFCDAECLKSSVIDVLECRIGARLSMMGAGEPKRLLLEKMDLLKDHSESDDTDYSGRSDGSETDKAEYGSEADEPSMLAIPVVREWRDVFPMALTMLCTHIKKTKGAGTPSISDRLIVRALAIVPSLRRELKKNISVPQVYSTAQLSPKEVHALHLLVIYNRIVQLLLIEHELAAYLKGLANCSHSIEVSTFLTAFRTLSANPRAFDNHAKAVETLCKFLDPIAHEFLLPWSCADESGSGAESWEDELTVLPKDRVRKAALQCESLVGICTGFNFDTQSLVLLLKDNTSFEVPRKFLTTGSQEIVQVFWRDRVRVFLTSDRSPLDPSDVVHASIETRAWHSGKLVLTEGRAGARIEGKNIDFISEIRYRMIEKRRIQRQKRPAGNYPDDLHADDADVEEYHRCIKSYEIPVSKFAKVEKAWKDRRAVQFRIAFRSSKSGEYVEAVDVHAVC